MQIRHATTDDLPALRQIVAQAQLFFCENGIDQWQDGYPDDAVLLGDIAHNTSYVLEVDGAVRAMFMTACEDDPNYAHIDGAWLTQGQPYAVLHRIAVEGTAKGGGLAGCIVEFVCNVAAGHAQSVRVDTHCDNAPMRRMLEKHGFLYCGKITLGSGAPRVAYEKIV